MNEISTNWAACIVYYQDQESLLNLLASLEQQSFKPGHVFIADNNSIQSIVLKNYSFPVQVTKLDENKGFAAGANVALKNAINNKKGLSTQSALFTKPVHFFKFITN